MTNNILDQSTDTDFSCLHKILCKVASTDIVEALSTIEINYDSMEKLGSEYFADQTNNLFPVDTAENTLLSKLYFDQQQNAIDEKTASDISDRLDTFLDIHNIPSEVFEYSSVQKTASDSTLNSTENTVFTLLPELGICKVATEQDLQDAGDLFTKEGANLSVSDRVKFSQNFVKVASYFEVTDYPKEVAKYAACLDTDLENTKYLLNARALLTKRIGKDGEQYTKLAECIDTIDTTPDSEELVKLADTIHSMDVSFGLDAKKYDRHIPCAYSSVFNKEAEENSKDTDEEKLKNMDKAGIIGKYGTEALEQVEDDNGDINLEKLKKVVQVANDYKPEVDTKEI